MAELKRNFLKSKMNKDLDERLVPNGEYRDALNIEIASSEGDDVGTAQNLKGNSPTFAVNTYTDGNPTYFSTNATTVGSYVDEESSLVYNFVKDYKSFVPNGVYSGAIRYTGIKSDAIVEQDPTKDTEGTIIMHDVYEVRIVPPNVMSTSSPVLTGLTGNKYSINSVGLQTDDKANIRLGMRVQLIALNGEDIWADRVVLVKSFTQTAQSAFTTTFDVTLTNLNDQTVGITQTQINQGCVLKFSAPRVLNFVAGSSVELESNTEYPESTPTPSDTMITAINKLDDTLLFTDGRNEPKKINIKRFKLAKTTRITALSTFTPHTALIITANNYNYYKGFVEESHITTIKPNPNVAPIAVGKRPSGDDVLGPIEVACLGKQSLDNENFWEPFAMSTSNDVLFDIGHTVYIQTQSDTNYTVNTVLKLTGVTSGAIAVVRVTEILDDPNAYATSLTTLSSTYVGSTADEIWSAVLVSKETLYADKFVSFAYRYKYVDGEYSSISPYSSSVFVPSNFSYVAKDGFNLGMENQLSTIELQNYIPKDIPKDVTRVELVVKESRSANFIIGQSFEFDLTNNFNYLANNGVENHYLGFTTDKLVIDEEFFGTTVPSNQLTRNFDAVPTTAKAQEVTSNRLMYGNYTTDYDLKSLDTNNVEADVSIVVRSKANTSSTVDTSNTLYLQNKIESITAVADMTSGISSFYPGTYGEFNVSRPVNFGTEYDVGNNWTNMQLDNTTSPIGYNAYYTAPSTGSYKFQLPALYVNGIQNGSGNTIETFGCFPALVMIDSNGDPVDSAALGPVANPIYKAFPSAPLTYQDPDNPGVQIGAVDSSEGFVLSFHPYEIPETPEISLTANDRVAVLFYTPSGYSKLVASGFGDVFTIEAAPGSYNSDSVQGIGKSVFKVTSAPGTTNTLPSLIGAPSVKSMRNYELGVVYRDSYGRETSVLTDKNQNFSISKDNCATLNQLEAKANNLAPAWAETYKFFIKETAERYYNMVADSAFLSTSGTDAWLVFNSSDRNKVKVGDYLSLKKKFASATPVTANEAKWKILDIQNEGVSSDDESSVGTVSVDGVVIASDSNIIGKFFVKVIYDSDFATYIENLETNGDVESTNNLNGAVFETQTTNNLDLDLFYEVGHAYPIALTGNLAKDHIQKGYTITWFDQSNGIPVEAVADQWTNGSIKVDYVVGASKEALFADNYLPESLCEVYVTQSLVAKQVPNEGWMKVKITAPDGGYIVALVDQDVTSGSNCIKLKPRIHRTIGSDVSCEVGLPWHNCYAFGNGVESDTIRDDFNGDVIYTYTDSGKSSGFKANIPIDEYKKQYEPNKIIFSQIYNENANVNALNQFLIAENIIKTVNPEYGSITKLFTRNTDLVVLCDQKVVKVLASKDALFNADGSDQLLSSSAVLGQIIPFTGDFGCQNAESFTTDEYRMYFVDRARGAVIRLSADGATPISSYGMKDWFNDHLKNAKAIIGTFDSKKEEYNITIHEVNKFTDNKDMYTLSFNEDINGWSSFKSFMPESGFTLNNVYYTMKNGGIYAHHSDTALRNNFYGNQYTSSINPVFNDAPTVVKSFKTMNYEGTQSKVDQNVTPGTGFYNLESKNGWYVEKITTDQQQGQIPEFIEKEGKWFNYIKGFATTFVNLFDGSQANNNLDSKEFTTQGLGQLVSNAYLEDSTDTTPTLGFTINFTNTTQGGFNQTEWSSQGLTLNNVSSVSGVSQFVLTPNAGYIINSQMFPTITFNNSDGIAGSISFSDSGSPVSVSNTVVATVSWTGTITKASGSTHDVEITIVQNESNTLGLEYTLLTTNLKQLTDQGGVSSTVAEMTVSADSINNSWVPTYSEVTLNGGSTGNVYAVNSYLTNFGETDPNYVCTVRFYANDSDITQTSSNFGYYNGTPELNISFPENLGGYYDVAQSNVVYDEYGRVNYYAYIVSFYRTELVESISDDGSEIFINAPQKVNYFANFDTAGTAIIDNASNTSYYNINTNYLNINNNPITVTLSDTWLTSANIVTVGNQLCLEVVAPTNAGADRTLTATLKSPDGTISYESLTITQQAGEFASIYMNNPNNDVPTSITTSRITSAPYSHAQIIDTSSSSTSWAEPDHFTGYIYISTNQDVTQSEIQTQTTLSGHTESSSPWIYIFQYESLQEVDGNNAGLWRLHYTVRNNNTGADRTATITYTHPDDAGVNDAITITQVRDLNAASTAVVSVNGDSDGTVAVTKDAQVVPFEITLGDFTHDQLTNTGPLFNQGPYPRNYGFPGYRLRPVVDHLGYAQPNWGYSVYYETWNTAYVSDPSAYQYKLGVEIPANTAEGNLATRKFIVDFYHPKHSQIEYVDNTENFQDTVAVTQAAENGVFMFEDGETPHIGSPAYSFPGAGGNVSLRLRYNGTTPTIGLWKLSDPNDDTSAREYQALAAGVVDSTTGISYAIGSETTVGPDVKQRILTVTRTANDEAYPIENDVLAAWHSSLSPSGSTVDPSVSRVMLLQPAEYDAATSFVDILNSSTSLVNGGGTNYRVEFRVSDYTTAQFNDDDERMLFQFSTSASSYEAVNWVDAPVALTKNPSWSSGSDTYTHFIDFDYTANTTNETRFFYVKAKHILALQEDWTTSINFSQLPTGLFQFTSGNVQGDEVISEITIPASGGLIPNIFAKTNDLTLDQTQVIPSKASYPYGPLVRFLNTAGDAIFNNGSGVNVPNGVTWSIFDNTDTVTAQFDNNTPGALDELFINYFIGDGVAWTWNPPVDGIYYGLWSQASQLSIPENTTASEIKYVIGAWSELPLKNLVDVVNDSTEVTSGTTSAISIANKITDGFDFTNTGVSATVGQIELRLTSDDSSFPIASGKYYRVTYDITEFEQLGAADSSTQHCGISTTTGYTADGTSGSGLNVNPTEIGTYCVQYKSTAAYIPFFGTNQSKFKVRNIKVEQITTPPVFKAGTSISAYTPTDTLTITQLGNTDVLNWAALDGLNNCPVSNDGFANAAVGLSNQSFTEATVQNNQNVFAPNVLRLGIDNVLATSNAELREWNGSSSSSFLADDMIMTDYGINFTTTDLVGSSAGNIGYFEFAINPNLGSMSGSGFVSPVDRQVVIGLYDGTPTSSSQAPLATFTLKQSS